MKEQGRVRCGWVLVLLPHVGDHFFNTVILNQHIGGGLEVRRRDEDEYFRKEDVCEEVEAFMRES